MASRTRVDQIRHLFGPMHPRLRIYCAEVSPQLYKTYLMISNKEKASLPVTHVTNKQKKKNPTYWGQSGAHRRIVVEQRFNSVQGNLVALVLFDG